MRHDEKKKNKAKKEFASITAKFEMTEAGYKQVYYKDGEEPVAPIVSTNEHTVEAAIVHREQPKIVVNSFPDGNVVAFGEGLPTIGGGGMGEKTQQKIVFEGVGVVPDETTFTLPSMEQPRIVSEDEQKAIEEKNSEVTMRFGKPYKKDLSGKWKLVK